MPGDLTDRERVELHEMARAERLEIEFELLRDLEAKGYEIVRHGPNAATYCFSCTLSRLVDSLPKLEAPGV